MALRDGGVPAYRSLADRLAEEITSGVRPPGQRLPTVRRLARESGLSQGTVTHAYDLLEREGYINKEQGRGTFVREGGSRAAGDKGRAMVAIDRLLDDMQGLGFSWHETRIFLDLKLRQREEGESAVRVEAVDCNPEALAMMREQIAALPHAEVATHALASVLESERPYAPKADIVVTTATHGDALQEKMSPGRELVRLVMSLETETALALAAIPADARVGVICKSPRFADIIRQGCGRYCRPGMSMAVAYFGDSGAVAGLADSSEVLILAPNYTQFANGAETAAVEGFPGVAIPYRYQVEQGSLVYLERQVAACHRARVTGEGD